MPLGLLSAAARFSPADAAARAVRHPLARALGAVLGPAVRAADAFCRAYAARRLLREMRDWPDHRLRDIGLTRAELAAAILGVRRPYRWVPETDPDAPPVSRARR